jgi:hypothetical protein|tara:strand:+ start:69 stop:290 length:222 start_codon:yes stop_codon:yes gene_type:complete
MTSHSKILSLIVVLAFLLTILLSGCSALQDKHDSLLIPPNVIDDDQLICTSEIMSNCDGFLTQKDIDKENDND